MKVKAMSAFQLNRGGIVSFIKEDEVIPLEGISDYDVQILLELGRVSLVDYPDCVVRVNREFQTEDGQFSGNGGDTMSLPGAVAGPLIVSRAVTPLDISLWAPGRMLPKEAKKLYEADDADQM